MTIADSHDKQKEGDDKTTETPTRKLSYVRKWMPDGGTRKGDGSSLLANADEHEIAQRPSVGVALQDDQTSNASNGVQTVNLRTFLLDGYLRVTFRENAAYQSGNYWLIDVTVRRGTVQAADGRGIVPVRGMRHYAPIRSGEKDHGRRENLMRPLPTTPRDSNALDFLPAHLSDAKRNSQAAPADESPPSALLSDAGVKALKEYIRTPQEVLRRIPARYLNAPVTFPALVAWLAPALISEIADLSFEEFAEEFKTVQEVPREDWPLFEKEAREVLGKAREFSRVMASNSGFQSLMR